MNMRQKSESVPSPIGDNGIKRMFDTVINGAQKRRTRIDTKCAIDTRSAPRLSTEGAPSYLQL